MEAITSNDFYFVIVSYLGKMSTFSLPLSLTVFSFGREGLFVCLGLFLFWILFVVLGLGFFLFVGWVFVGFVG